MNTKNTCPCNEYPLISNFYIVKLGYTYFCSKRLGQFSETCTNNQCFEQKKYEKISKEFSKKFSIFTVKNLFILHEHVQVFCNILNCSFFPASCFWVGILNLSISIHVPILASCSTSLIVSLSVSYPCLALFFSKKESSVPYFKLKTWNEKVNCWIFTTYNGKENPKAASDPKVFSSCKFID